MRWLVLFGLLLGSACSGLIMPPAGDGPDDDDERIPPEGRALAPLARRLHPQEYANTVRDVLGVTLTADELARLPVDRPVRGFAHVASGQTVLPDHVRAYAALADAIVARPAFAEFLAARVGCDDTSPACARELVDVLGEALFRRPLEDASRAPFVALHAEVVELGADVAEARAAVGAAMLQSPGFLYLLQDERTGEGTRALDDWEMASQISYALRASAPDEELRRAAAAGELQDPAGIERQIDRLLADDARLRELAARFLRDWARLESLPDDDGLRAELVDAASAYYAERLARGEDLLGLLGDGQVVLTGELARRYGVESRGEGLESYDVAELGRGGLLLQPGVIAGMTNADGGEIVARGLFLQTQVFCGETPDPPASLQEAIDEFVAEQPADASDRQIAEARLERAQCARCHAQFDPLAYGFERFDHRGAYRTMDEHGNELGTDGWVPLALAGEEADVPYADLSELAGLLSGNARVQRCWTEQQAEMLLGRALEDAQAPQVAALSEEVAAAGGTYQDHVRALLTHDLFRRRQVVE